MEVVILDTSADVAQRSADIICRLIQAKPNAVLGMATGSTPLELYQELIKRHKAGEISFKEVTTFNLDEYIGLHDGHEQSYRYFMDHHLFRHLDINPERTHVPEGNAANPVEVGPAYEQKIRNAGGIDLQILGIGTDGHIGFNEPTSSLSSRTRIKTLTEQTIEDNQRFFKEGQFQPRVAITMGIGTILEARQILLLATGVKKARAVADSVEGPLCANCPASALQWHNKTSFILDETAAESLERKAYYKWVLKHQDDITAQFGAS